MKHEYFLSSRGISKISGKNCKLTYLELPRAIITELLQPPVKWLGSSTTSAPDLYSRGWDGGTHLCGSVVYSRKREDVATHDAAALVYLFFCCQPRYFTGKGFLSASTYFEFHVQTASLTWDLLINRRSKGWCKFLKLLDMNFFWNLTKKAFLIKNADLTKWLLSLMFKIFCPAAFARTWQYSFVINYECVPQKSSLSSVFKIIFFIHQRLRMD